MGQVFGSSHGVQLYQSSDGIVQTELQVQEPLNKRWNVLLGILLIGPLVNVSLEAARMTLSHDHDQVLIGWFSHKFFHRFKHPPASSKFSKEDVLIVRSRVKGRLMEFGHPSNYHQRPN